MIDTGTSVARAYNCIYNGTVNCSPCIPKINSPVRNCERRKSSRLTHMSLFAHSNVRSFQPSNLLHCSNWTVPCCILLYSKHIVRLYECSVMFFACLCCPCVTQTRENSHTSTQVTQCKQPLSPPHCSFQRSLHMAVRLAIALIVTLIIVNFPVCW